MIIIIMGVQGAGKTLIGQTLCDELEWDFYDADDYHSASNIEKLSRSIPLTEQDRKPWLRTLNLLLQRITTESKPAILACSALKQSYRDNLIQGISDTHFVYLKGDEKLIRDRLEKRQDHFAKAALLASQFENLEEPKDAFVVNISSSPKEIVDLIKSHFHL